MEEGNKKSSSESGPDEGCRMALALSLPRIREVLSDTGLADWVASASTALLDDEAAARRNVRQFAGHALRGQRIVGQATAAPRGLFASRTTQWVRQCCRCSANSTAARTSTYTQTFLEWPNTPY